MPLRTAHHGTPAEVKRAFAHGVCPKFFACSPTLNKWRMEVLTRSVSGTVFFYARYQEGAEPVFHSFAGRQPVTLGADQLTLGVDK